MKTRITVTILPTSEMKIIKQINLVSPNCNGIDVTVGIILYEREFSETYKFKEKSEEENNTLNLTRKTKQEDYPNDDLDLRILEAVKLDFPKAQLNSDLLFSTSHVEHYNNLAKRPSEKAELTFIPDFSGINLESLSRKSFEAFRKQINIYAHGNTELIKNRMFRGYCDLENHEIFYERLNKINFR